MTQNPTLLKRMEEIQWFHKVPLRDGRVTPGEIPIFAKEASYLFNRLDFRGKSVLDIGCWDGYFSFMAEQRGASRVVALDNPEFRWGGMDGFNFLHDHFQSAVEFRKGSVFDAPKERFDIVLCYGVLYHLSNPLAAAIRCFRMAKDRVVFEGHFFDVDLPMMYLLKPGEIDQDRSNFFSMTTGCMKAVAEAYGFALEAQHLRQSVPGESNPKFDRAALMFRRVSDQENPYRDHCFPD